MDDKKMAQAFDEWWEDLNKWGTGHFSAQDAAWQAWRYFSWISDHAGQLYQACGAYDLPDRVLDNLSDMVDMKEPRHDMILPCNPPVSRDPMEG